MPPLAGLHHVTAITTDAQKNVNFYTALLGLSLVKLTVNFDDPRSYHLYYGSPGGDPGTLLTFFAWPGVPRGRVGPPQVTATAFAIPRASLDFWTARLAAHNVPVALATRFGHPVLTIADPDAMPIELIPSDMAEAAKASPPAHARIPPAHALTALHSVTLSIEGYENTAALLTGVLGFTLEASEQNRFRFRAAPHAAEGAPFAATVDLLCTPGARAGQLGAGVVHHVAFRTPTDADQAAWRAALVSKHFNVSPVMDRSYFHSIYFREPGGVLFEIATAGPGFAIDEPAGQLGRRLMLPAQYEPLRATLEQLLPPLRLG